MEIAEAEDIGTELEATEREIVRGEEAAGQAAASMTVRTTARQALITSAEAADAESAQHEETATSLLPRMHEPGVAEEVVERRRASATARMKADGYRAAAKLHDEGIAQAQAEALAPAQALLRARYRRQQLVTLRVMRLFEAALEAAAAQYEPAIASLVDLERAAVVAFDRSPFGDAPPPRVLVGRAIVLTAKRLLGADVGRLLHPRWPDSIPALSTIVRDAR